MKREVGIPNKCTGSVMNNRSGDSIVRSTGTSSHSSFLIKSMIHYECYTDGAYSSARNQGGIGIVFLRNGERVMDYSKGFKDTTNNRMEIGAALYILKCFKRPVDKITIYTDSMYVIGCATLGWKRKKNIELWKQFDEEYRRVSKLCPSITFQHVKGHAENKWNNYVDQLAVAASHELL
jgi:ribonuclease HI